MLGLLGQHVPVEADRHGQEVRLQLAPNPRPAAILGWARPLVEMGTQAVVLRMICNCRGARFISVFEG